MLEANHNLRVTGSAPSHLSGGSPHEWFVVQTKRSKETYARDHLRRQHFKTFFPRITTSSRRRGKFVTNHVPLFPGYLFVAFDPVCLGWHSINGTRGVSRLLCSDSGRPQALPHNFMMSLLESSDDSEIVSWSYQNLSDGDPIEIVHGPFAKKIGQLISLHSQGRAQVLLSLMGASICVDLSVSALKPAHA
jgi:transcriptional antiterminator RfaH